MRSRESARRRASLLALALFVLGSVAAPAIDAWHHANEAEAAAHDTGVHDCVVCRLASTPTSLPPTPAPHLGAGEKGGGWRFAKVQTHVPVANARLTPPTRAPPA